MYQKNFITNFYFASSYNLKTSEQKFIIDKIKLFFK